MTTALGAGTTDKDIPKWNAATESWESNANYATSGHTHAGTGASTTLAGLADVTGTSTVTNNQVLMYDSGATLWAPDTLTAALVSAATTGHTHLSPDINGIVTTGSSPTFVNLTASTGILATLTVTITGTVANLSSSFLESNPASKFSTTGHAHVSSDVVGVVATGSTATLHDLTLTVTGAAPLTVTGTTVVTNLNADMLDGYEASRFYTTGSTVANATDADTLDSRHAVSFAVTGSNVTFGIVTTTNLIATGSDCTLGVVTTTNLVATGSNPTFGIVTSTNLVSTGAAAYTTNIVHTGADATLGVVTSTNLVSTGSSYYTTSVVHTGSDCTLGVVTTTNLVATGSSPTFGVVASTNLVSTGAATYTTSIVHTGSDCTLGVVTTTNLVATGSNCTLGIVATTNLVATGSSPTFVTATVNTGVASVVSLSRWMMLTSTGAADHSANGIIINATAGENLVFGSVTYPSGGSYYKADAGSATTMPAIAICISGANAASGTTFLIDGIVRDDSWTWVCSPGTSGIIYVSGAAGTLTQTTPSTTGDQVQVVGYALAPTFLLWRPTLTWAQVA